MAKNANRVRNWRKYNEALIQRGSLTFWFDASVTKNWYEKTSSKKGRPKKYTDFAIQCGLTLKALFNYDFRRIQGFIESLIKLLKLQIEAPHYTSLCRRQKNLDIRLPKTKINREDKINILVDSTGIKVYGEGEWKVRIHGWKKHRLWRKLHLAVNSKTQEIEAQELTTLGIQDCEGFKILVDKIEDDIESATADGAYDRFLCYELAEQNNFKLITPPQRNAQISTNRWVGKKKASPNAVKMRDKVIKKVWKMGRKKWKKAIGYHKRSLAETTMFRIKAILGHRLKSRIMEHQKTEAAVWCGIINKMTKLGFGY